MRVIILLISLLLTGCTEFYAKPTPDYIAIYNKVAEFMHNQGKKSCTPPIVFVKDPYVLGAMFPKLQEKYKGQQIYGVYYCGMVYLSVPNISDFLIAHEFTHYLGGNEDKSVAVSEKLY